MRATTKPRERNNTAVITAGDDPRETTLDPPEVMSAALIVVSGSDIGRSHRIGARVVIGRDAEEGIPLSDPSASREHARIERRDGRYHLYDLGSRNGTWLNRERIENAPLKHGDRVRVGRTTTFMFVQHAAYEEQILRMQKLYALGELASGVSHDFNNMLVAVLGSIDDVLATSELSPASRESLQDGRAAAQRCISLTEQLVGFAASRRPASDVVDLGAVLGELTTLLRRTLPASVELQVSSEPELFVLGAAPKLYQVLLNLATNARDAMPDGGQLAIHATRLTRSPGTLPGYLAPGAYVRIDVEDTGTGMTEEVRRRVFEPFYTNKPPGSGSGLGLSTAYGIVRATGGEMYVRSTVGRGSAFSVHLPAAPAGARPPAPAGRRREEARPDAVPTGTTVLIADDEPIVRRTFARLLTRRGYTVLTAADGVEALRVLEEHHGEIVAMVLDLDMPQVDGRHVLSRLMASGSRLPVIVASGSADDSLPSEMLGAGAATFLRKPFSPVELISTLSQVTAR